MSDSFQKRFGSSHEIKNEIFLPFYGMIHVLDEDRKSKILELF
ncbi:MAG: hypothetical protein ACTSWY_08640 [Promethearchaeota archaeon]